MAPAAPKRCPVEDLVEDIAYCITATIFEKKEDSDLYSLYQKNGGKDKKSDFYLKWDSGEVQRGNIREMTELREKLIIMKS